MPATQMKRLRPTLPEREKIVDGVAKMPVPTMRLKMRKKALRTPISRLVSVRVWSKPEEPTKYVSVQLGQLARGDSPSPCSESGEMPASVFVCSDCAATGVVRVR